MLFSSITFSYYFLPLTILLYFLIPMPGDRVSFRNAFLLLASVIFYAWGEPYYLFLVGAQILSGWGFGLLIHRWRGTKKAKAALIACVSVGLGFLMFYKYADFFITNVNLIPGLDIPLLKLSLPIGISFYTFQIFSYDIDLYRGKTAPQKNLADFATYTMLFPQLMAGPIVRYVDIEKQLVSRGHSLEEFSLGARRFVAGLAKKVLFANMLGELVEILKTGDEKSLLASWLCVFAYGLHVYFDFSGYSDMAIGLGRIFGFKFFENFNYPFISKSITEFWRRWHISLGSWFRDYVYIPLGGNRKNQVFNIMTVWFLTGFWHGAGWNFIVWGMFFGVLLLGEKLLWGKGLEKAPAILRHAYVLLIVLVSWTFFDSASMGEAAARVGGMFGFGITGLSGTASLYYLRSYLLTLVLAALGATPLPKRLFERLEKRAPRIMAVIEPAGVAVLLLLATAFLVDGSFNPFIYFRF